MTGDPMPAPDSTPPDFVPPDFVPAAPIPASPIPAASIPAAPIPPDKPGPRVLLVDARPERSALIRMVVEAGQGGGTVVASAGTPSEAVAAVDRQAVDAAVVEIQMPVDVGLAAIAALRAGHPSLVIVVCSFHGDALTRQQAYSAGANSYLTKPVSARDLQAACVTPVPAV